MHNFGVLRHGSEASKAQSYKWGRAAVQIGGVLQYFSDKLYALWAPTVRAQIITRTSIKSFSS